MTNHSTPQLNIFFLILFSLLALTGGYWTLVTREALLARTDNPRALIAYNRIQRGRILDRQGRPLVETVGQPGDYVRYSERSAALVVGYASFRYGLSGIEAAADPTLTGVEGQDELTQWWHYELLNEPQRGKDVKLTLDLDLQRAAYQALDGHPGAAILLDIASGDILAMASSPSFNPAQIDSEFENFTADSNGPLINRATLGLYRADALLNLFPKTIDLSIAPNLPIPTGAAAGKRVTPLQVTLLTAAAANLGLMPAPRLWLESSEESQPVVIMSPAAAQALTPMLAAGFASTVASGFGDETLGWYIGLSADRTQALCVVLEDSDAATAKEVAARLLPK